MGGGRARRALFALAAAAGGTLAALLLLEGGLRLLPVATDLGSLPVDSASPTLRSKPNSHFTFSRDWNLALARRGRVNAAGFVSDIEYDSTGAAPLVAVIGDSYVQALMVEHDSTLQGRLHRAAGGARRVYGFGSSGAPLSQYLALASFARERYAPQALVIPIIGNDFDESLLRYKAAPGFHYFVESGDSLRLELRPFEPSRAGHLVRSSALLRYLVFNLLLPGRLAAWRAGAPAQGFVANTSTSLDSTRVALSLRAVDEFLRRLPSSSGVAPERTVLLLDGLRPDLYDSTAYAAAGASYVAEMRAQIARRATARGFEVIDLEPEFRRLHAATGERFEHPNDNHWSARGHRVAADAVLHSRMWASLDSAPTALIPGVRR